MKIKSRLHVGAVAVTLWQSRPRRGGRCLRSWSRATGSSRSGWSVSVFVGAGD